MNTKPHCDKCKYMHTNPWGRRSCIAKLMELGLSAKAAPCIAKGCTKFEPLPQWEAEYIKKEI